MIHSIPERDEPLVLVIDDDQSMRRAMEAVMVSSGFEVVLSESGPAAIELCAQRQPNLVFLDVDMPDMDGFEICRAIRELPGGKFIQILMVTGPDDEDSIKRAFTAGADGCIATPINSVMLRHRGRYMLRAGKTLEKLSNACIRLEKIQEMARLGSWEINLQTGAFSCSEQACQLLGIDAAGRDIDLDAFLAPVFAAEQGEARRAIELAIQEGKPLRIVYQVVHPDDSRSYILNQGKILVDEQNVARIMLGAVQDITVQKLAEEEIKRLAFFDGLTGLSNRVLFMSQLEQEIALAQRMNTSFALLYLDLDRFKQVNDTFGHYVGDLLLQQVARALLQCIRATDIASRFYINDLEKKIARLGGDEFTIILSGVSKVEHVAIVARRIIKEIPKPYIIEGHNISITASVGISMYPADGKSADILLKHADTAMYQAKNSGRNNYQFFREELNMEVVERFALERDIARGLERSEFILYYQPKIDLSSMAIVGAEALIRWNHPERGMVPPAKFIPIAEECGQIIGITCEVVRSAISQWQQWREAGYEPGVVAVNISGDRFGQQKVMQAVTESLATSGLDPACLEVEVTENFLMQHLNEADTILQRLKSRQVRIGLDDFGTGYSSLSHLASLKVDTLKIDRSFVMGCIDIPGDLAVIRTIVAMARSLGVKTVAEGIETAEQLALVRQHGVDMAQGYYFSEPVPAEKFRLMLPKPGSRARGDGGS